MNDETSQPQQINVVQVEYIDYANYYTIYGISTMIVILLLLWSIARKNPSVDYTYNIEGMDTKNEEKDNINEKKYTDSKYKYGPLPKGVYGDVDVYFNETPDNQFASQWLSENGGIYLHNSKTYWRDVNTPYESNFWNKSGDPIVGVPEKWQKVYSPVNRIVKW